MTGEQTSIPVPPAPQRGACAWCGTETSLQIDLQKGATLTRGIRVPKWAWACSDHLRTLKRRGND
jgi:hypothetical protein